MESRLPLAAEVEPNDTRAQATLFLSSDLTHTGRLSNLNDQDYFQVALTQGQRFNATVTQPGTFDPEVIGGVEIQDSAGRVLSRKYADTAAEIIAPADGTYYFRTAPPNELGTFTGSYVIGTTVNAYSGVTETEPNDTTGTATAATVGSNFRGNVSNAGDLDYFSFSGTSGNVVSIDFVNVPADAPAVIVYRASGVELGRGDVGTGVQLTLPATETYRFAVTSARVGGPFTGQYVGRITTAASPVNISAGLSFDTAVPAPLGASATSIIGTLPTIDAVRFFSFDVTTLHQTSVSFNSIGQNVKVSLFNERGQILDYRFGTSLFTSSIDLGFTAGRYFVAVQPLSDAGLGPFQLSLQRSQTLSNQRDVPLVWVDFTAQASHIGQAWVTPFGVPAAIPFVLGMFESRFDVWDVDITTVQPPAGTEMVGAGYGEFGNTGVGGRGGGSYGTRRPSGDSFTDCATTTWTSLTYDCTLTLIHESGHASGLLHSRSVQGVMGYDNNDEIFQVGRGYVFPGTDSFVPSSFVNNPRDYMDWTHQPGYQLIEAEPNDSAAAASGLDAPLATMQVEFTAGGSTATGAGTNPMDLRVVNLNSDAWPDLVVTHNTTETITTHLGTGVGVFGPPTSYSPGVNLPFAWNALTTGDLNGDTRDDIVLANYNGSTVLVYLTNADGTLTAPSSINTVNGSQRVLLKDLNNDTRLDLLAGSWNGVLSVYLGVGNGTFGARTPYNVGGSGIRDIAVGHVDADGFVDVVTANIDSDNVSVLRGSNTGALQAAVTYPVGDGPVGLFLEDLNGNGVADLLVANQNAQTVAFVPGTGSAAFGAAVPYSTGGQLYAMERADVNNDGRGDALLLTDSGARYMLTAANGSLSQPVLLTSRLSTSAVSRDLNADGRNDLLIGNYFDNRVDLLFGAANDVRNDRITVFGRIDSASDQDFYSFTATAGGRYAFDVDAAEFQYPVDAVLTVYDSLGNVVFSADDGLDRDSGIDSVDPYVLHTFASAGTYTARITGKNGSAGFYRFKLTPSTAFDDDGPKVLGTFPAGQSSTKSTRQLIFYLNDRLDPATLTAANIVVQSGANGVRPGTAYFDPTEAVLVWTADTNLPIDSYTVTLVSGATGIRDLLGNQLDGETDGTFVFPEVSGNGAAGGNFSFNFTINANDTAAATVAASYSRHPYNRGMFTLSFGDTISLPNVASAPLIARGAGPDATFNTVDDRILPLDTLQDSMNHRQQIRAYTRGVPDPDQYRIEGAVRDTAGFTINLSLVVNVGVEVPQSALFTSSAMTQTGLTGRYVNSSLRAYSPQDDWQATQTISGTRIDPTIDFVTGDFGTRSEVGVTGGTDANWDNFSVQWDGYLQVPVDGTRLLLRSSHGSRMWIDLNNDGIFGASGGEFISNNWGSTGSTIGTLGSQAITAGLYRIRVQYEHQTGSEQAFLEWITPDYAGRVEGNGHGPSVVDSSIQAGSTLVAGGTNSIDVFFSGAIDPATLTTTNFRIRYSPDPRFYNGNDVYLTEGDGVIAWEPTTRKATFQASQVFNAGYYLLELNGDAGGIADRTGRLLDGEFLDSYIAGTTQPMLWQDGPSGDGLAGGDYLAPFTISTFTATVAVAPAQTNEDAAGNLVYTFTRVGDTSGAATVNFSVSGGAVFGTDYSQSGAATFSTSAGTVTFAAGSATAVVTIDPTADADAETDETVVLTLLTGAAYNLGTPIVATGTILNDEPTTLRVTSLTSRTGGFDIQLSHAVVVDASLNLYDYKDSGGASVLGPADVQLVGNSVGAIAGSLIVSADNKRLTFQATSGVLPPDSYTVTIRSAANGVRRDTGELLDGNADGVAGGDYVSSFVVAAPAVGTVTVSLPNFSRGPEQAVNVPADAALGVPLTVSDGDQIKTVDFILQFDAGLLSVTGVTLPVGAPALSSALLTPLGPGQAQVSITFGSPLAAGPQVLAYLTAAVPTTAAARYGERGTLDMTSLVVRNPSSVIIPSLDDDAVHANAYFGDLGRNGRYDSFDVQQASRLAVRLDTGFQQHPLLDPTILADFNGNGRIDSFDVQQLSRLALRLPVSGTAALPSPLPTVTDTDRLVAEEPPTEKAPEVSPAAEAPPPLRSDIDGNGAVDAQDVLWALYYFNHSADDAASEAARARLDVNGDQSFDPADILLTISDFNARTSAGESEPVAAPDETDALTYLLAEDWVAANKKNRRS